MLLYKMILKSRSDSMQAAIAKKSIGKKKMVNEEIVQNKQQVHEQAFCVNC